MNKNDRAAIDHFGSQAYGDISKAAFAVVAWHLANAASASCDAEGAAEARIIEEAGALVAAGILPEAHGRAIKKALQPRASLFTEEA